MQLDPTEIQLIDLISRFPAEVQRAAAEYKTLAITNLAYELARAFNDFYNACPVLKAEPKHARSAAAAGGCHTPDDCQCPAAAGDRGARSDVNKGYGR